MKTATRIKEMTSWKGNAALYKLSEPMDQERYDDDGNETVVKHAHVIVSAVRVEFEGNKPETYIFGANEDGEIANWGELSGSFKGGLDHAKALKNAGYEIVEAKP